MSRPRDLLALTLLAGAAAAPLRAQEVAPLQVGQTAPDFALTGATRFGVLMNPVKLGDFKGQTVVLAFFYKARSGG